MLAEAGILQTTYVATKGPWQTADVARQLCFDEFRVILIIGTGAGRWGVAVDGSPLGQRGGGRGHSSFGLSVWRVLLDT